MDRHWLMRVAVASSEMPLPKSKAQRPSSSRTMGKVTETSLLYFLRIEMVSRMALVNALYWEVLDWELSRWKVTL